MVVGDLSASLFPLLLQLLVVSLLAARLGILNLVVFPLEATSLLLIPHLFFHEILGSVFPVDATRVPLCRAFDDGAQLRKCRNFTLATVLLVVSMGIEDITHLDKLEISFQ